MREAWLKREFGTATAIAAPRSFAPPTPEFRLAVDLGRDLFSAAWWRGAATLAAMIAALVAVAPGLEPLPRGIAPIESGTREQWQANGVGSLAAGSDSGLRMAAGDSVEPIGQAPERVAIDLYATVGRDGLGRGLERIGAAAGDALAVERLVRDAGARVAPGTGIAVRLGRKGAGARRPVERLEARAGFDLRILIERGPAGLALTRIPIAVDRRPLRIRGRAGDGLYWSLRSAGASPAAAAAFLKALATRLDVGEVAGDDRFDLVLANRRTGDGESQAGPLLYAGLDRAAQGDLQLLLWNAGGRLSWIDAADLTRSAPADAMAWPVNARITSGFGMRVHPILRFARMHRGMDFGAGHGTPIHAAADGQVSRAGWAGGYGRQVRLAHAGGIATSYSHMSRMVVEPGMLVRQGQLIGYVGSSGLSTGPHLHYEVYRGGVAVDPMAVRFAGGGAVDPALAKAVKARLKALLSS